MLLLMIVRLAHRDACFFVGRHHMVDVTGAIISDDNLSNVGHGMVNAMEVSTYRTTPCPFFDSEN